MYQSSLTVAAKISDEQNYKSYSCFLFTADIKGLLKVKQDTNYDGNVYIPSDVSCLAFVFLQFKTDGVNKADQTHLIVKGTH